MTVFKFCLILDWSAFSSQKRTRSATLNGSRGNHILHFILTFLDKTKRFLMSLFTLVRSRIYEEMQIVRFYSKFVVTASFSLRITEQQLKPSSSTAALSFAAFFVCLISWRFTTGLIDSGRTGYFSDNPRLVAVILCRSKCPSITITRA